MYIKKNYNYYMYNVCVALGRGSFRICLGTMEALFTWSYPIYLEVFGCQCWMGLLVLDMIYCF